MSDGKKLVAALLETGSTQTLRLVDRSLFEEDEVAVFDFVSRHFRRYGELPTIRTVETETRKRLPSVDESVDFYVKKVHDRRLFVQMREGFGDLREALQNFDIDAAKEIVGRLSGHCRVSSPDSDLRSIREAAEEVLRGYDDAHANPGMSGITTGFPTLDATTGGYQNGDLVAWVARMGIGKCMAPWTPVVKFDGSIVRVDTLRQGDVLMGPDSRPRQVLSTTRGREEMFRITPAHGEMWECNRSHILSLVCDFDIDKKHRKGQKYLYSVDEYLSLPSRVKANLRLWRAAVEFSPKPTPVDPYMVGLWLGDGVVGLPRIATSHPEIISYLEQFCEDNGGRLTQYEKREGACPSWGLVGFAAGNNPLGDFFNNECYRDDEKRIPISYLRNTRQVRLRLLAALIDTDGYSQNKHYEIITRYVGLSEDIKYLCRSLGFRVGCGTKYVDDRPYYRLTIYPDCAIPVRVGYKEKEPFTRRSPAAHATFRVESLGDGEYFGITLDKDHLYLLGDFTVTHNTYTVTYQAKAARDAGHSILFVTMEMTIAQIMRRWAAMDIGVSPEYIRKGSMSAWTYRRLQNYASTIAAADRTHFYAGSFSKKSSDIDLLMSELRPDIAYIDGAYLINSDSVPKNASRIDKVAGAFGDLKRMTITHNRPIVTTTQFSRAAGKKGKEGTLETISFSDAIAQNSSLVFGIKEGKPPNEKTRRSIETMKGREGESAEMETYYKFAPIDFSEVPPEQVSAESVDTDWMG